MAAPERGFGSSLEFDDPRTDPASVARRLGVSREAVDLLLSTDVIDLHVDSFIWTRVFGYDLRRRHGRGVFGARIYSQVDIPRALEGGLTGAAWVITTNPLRTARRRAAAFQKNVAHLLRMFESVPEHVRVVRSASEYRAARAEGRHGAFIAVQGGNALDHDLDDWARIPGGVVTRVTLVHLSSSSLGSTSSPAKLRDSGLTALGKELVRRLDELRIFVDLAHVSPKGFFDAVAVHDRSRPLIVTHTGVSAVRPHWRNLDDEQLRAIADSGGTVGVIYESSFLGGPRWGSRATLVADHLEHVVRTIGDDHASLGSDWDGAIVPPRDLATCLDLPRLVQILLDRRWPADRIRKILGANYLRALADLRG